MNIYNTYKTENRKKFRSQLKTTTHITKPCSSPDTTTAKFFAKNRFCEIWMIAILLDFPTFFAFAARVGLTTFYLYCTPCDNSFRAKFLECGKTPNPINEKSQCCCAKQKKRSKNWRNPQNLKSQLSLDP